MGSTFVWSRSGDRDQGWPGRPYRLSNPLARVQEKDKAIRITTDAMGETIAIGSGAEPLATASAALKDLEQILTARVVRRASLLCPPAAGGAQSFISE